MNSVHARSNTRSTSAATLALYEYIVAQFGHPRGFWGRVAGQIMAHRPSNRTRSRWVVDLLDIQPMDRVLELGCGPGVALELLSQRAHRGFVAGIDHSTVVVDQAQRRNARAIREGRVYVLQDSVEQLCSSAQPAPFDKIIAINTHMFWPNPQTALRQLSSLLKANGTIAIAQQPRDRHASDAAAQRAGAEMAHLLEQAGYGEICVTVQPMRPVATACVSARRCFS